MTNTNGSRLPPLRVAGRVERLRGRLDDAGVDALVVTTLPNVRYLTGFSGSSGVLVVTATRALLTTDGRYRTQSAEQVAGAGAEDLVEIEIGGQQAQRDAARAALAGARRVGLEADNVTWEQSRQWIELLGGTEVVPTTRVVEQLREVKDAAELARMERAAAIADAALGEVLPLLSAAGSSRVTEEQFALELDSAMRRAGAEGVAFDTIVAAGPNSAKPHHRPSGRPIGRGEPVVVDFGALFEGYRSDMTRTFCVGGEPTGELATIFTVVRDSQARGVAAVGPGVEAKAVDDACRGVIAAAGWAEKFEHGTGHGVGLDIHEAPTVSPLGTATLAPGVVVTVEPGVYLAGVGGVRIEDTLVVTEDGSRPLTHFTKDVAA
ncbi:MAG TPA: Xaa-Pro peptidase family protein [Acidimicrobiales bacterium]|nr:Xaa-Pro peptidase family protein [Acidimicrobiales bacterium]